ncbi:hypothetical protein TorRG33x02_351010, partial [Trema orientale]
MLLSVKISLSLYLSSSALHHSLSLSISLFLCASSLLSLSLFLSISALNHRRCLDSLLLTLSIPRL